jgi:hypothetical protein
MPMALRSDRSRATDGHVHTRARSLPHDERIAMRLRHCLLPASASVRIGATPVARDPDLLREMWGHLPSSRRGLTVERLQQYKWLIYNELRMAEREGFEPSVEFPLHTLSKRAPSTTRPSLHLESITCDQNQTNCVRPPNVPRSLTGFSSIAGAVIGEHEATSVPRPWFGNCCLPGRVSDPSVCCSASPARHEVRHRFLL